MNLYDFIATDSHGEAISLGRFEGKVLLIVNTATKCGLTPQYEQLETLYERYRERGFEVLDFPCNQFMNQAPGSDEEIDGFCRINYNTGFTRFSKVEVNGKNAHPLFVWLREQAPEDIGDEAAKSFERKVRLLRPLAKKGEIKWNFGKFLIDRRGEVAGRYSPGLTPDKMADDIEKLLADG